MSALILDPSVYGSHPHGNVGSVYFLQGVDGGPIKIGFTRYDVERRRKAIQGHSPVELAVIESVVVPWWVELEIHKCLAEYRLHGEWFADCAEVQQLIAFVHKAVEAAKAVTA